MRLALAYNTKDKLELVEQTWPRVRDTQCAVIWNDGSTEKKSLAYFESERALATAWHENVRGGADFAIVHGLTRLLQHPAAYTHVGMVESDVLLDHDWIEPTIDLFRKGQLEGLHVGAVSPRSYVDRLLIQRDGYAVCHNLGAGVLIMTREAAELVLRTFKTGWWPDNRYAFAQVSGVDIGTYAAFAGNQQNVTSDWSWEYQLIKKGLCALALTPSKVEMIGQNPPLAQQGLELTTGEVESRRNDEAFSNFVRMMDSIRYQKTSAEFVHPLHTQMGSTLFFPHQVGYLFAQQQGWRSKWCQGWGGFMYVAGPGGASLSVRCSGSISFLLSGGKETGANVEIVDTHSGFRTNPTLPPFQGQFTEVTVPGGFVPRTIALGLSEGGIFYGVSCADGQLLDASYSFSWDKLPEVA